LANGVTLLKDAYKSSLETVDCALDALEEIPAQRKLIVMGEISEPPGSQGPVYRRIGERMAKIASHVVMVGANFQRYSAGLRRGGLPGESLVDAGRGPVRAVEEIRRVWEPGDVVLIKGRDTQRLERIGLALSGRELRCDLPTCNATVPGPGVRCDGCPMFERGWEGRRVVF
jgi:UDP-N-acetylmuramyl pentapeptide synthase